VVLMTLIFIATSVTGAGWPWLPYLRAFAEAGMVGACADWFAVVALFRHSESANARMRLSPARLSSGWRSRARCCDKASAPLLLLPAARRGDQLNDKSS
jgi:hypothetical protein